MNTLKTLSLVTLLFFFSVDAGAQAPRRRGGRRPAAANPAAPQPVSQPQPDIAAPDTGAPSAPIALATVNGESITTANLDPKVRAEVEALDARIAEARKQVVELQINTMLLESEAAKRKTSPQLLYNLEIAKKVTEPTATEIDQFIQDNRAQITQTDPANLRQQVIDYLKAAREAQITDSFLK